MVIAAGRHDSRWFFQELSQNSQGSAVVLDQVRRSRSPSAQMQLASINNGFAALREMARFRLRVNMEGGDSNEIVERQISA